MSDRPTTLADDAAALRAETAALRQAVAALNGRVGVTWALTLAILGVLVPVLLRLGDKP